VQIVAEYEYIRQHFFGDDQVVDVGSAEPIFFAHKAPASRH
jgi:hypothetical protein